MDMHLPWTHDKYGSVVDARGKTVEANCFATVMVYCQDQIDAMSRASAIVHAVNNIDRITADLRKSEGIIQQYREDSARDERVNNELRASRDRLGADVADLNRERLNQAAAIDRITAERDGLRTQVGTLARERHALRSILERLNVLLDFGSTWDCVACFDDTSEINAACEAAFDLLATLALPDASGKGVA